MVQTEGVRDERISNYLLRRAICRAKKHPAFTLEVDDKIVPFLKEDDCFFDCFFLKTVISSRKATQDHLMTERPAQRVPSAKSAAFSYHIPDDHKRPASPHDASARPAPVARQDRSAGVLKPVMDIASARTPPRQNA